MNDTLPRHRSLRRASVALLAASLSWFPTVVLAADAAAKPNPEGGQGGSVALPMPLGGVRSPQQLIGLIIKGALGIVGAVALLMFVYGGILWLTSAGNQEKAGEAKKTLTWATIGLIAIFGSYAIANFIINTVLEKAL